MRPTPTCHRTIENAPTSLGPRTVGSPCIGSRCSAWCDYEADKPHLHPHFHPPSRHTGCCRDFNSSFHDSELWEDPARPVQPVTTDNE